ncbi:MAG: hypothetical protein NW220_09095 [Leptolyngbyaceae cyanobacterium bins.349]|nr:hypothetical protein [Leptolyngbyaceae cyanobacterium bins.349]
MQFKSVLRNGAIAAIAVVVASPLVAEAIPQRSRTACIQRTAEELGVPVGNIRITNVGPVSAESGAVTVNLENRTNGQTADCRVNTIDNTVLSVTPTNTGGSNPGSGTVSGQNPEFWVASTQTRFREKPGIFSRVVKGNVPKGTVLRNLGCQSTRMPTWCQVTYRDNPEFKGWVLSSDLEAYQANTTRPTTPSNNLPSTTTARPGDPVPGLNDLVGARAGQAEQTVTQRGYEFRNSRQMADSSFTYWMEKGTGNCVAIRTTEGRYGAIVYTSDRDCNRR